MTVLQSLQQRKKSNGLIQCVSKQQKIQCVSHLCHIVLEHLRSDLSSTCSCVGLPANALQRCYHMIRLDKTGSKCPLGQKHSLMGFTVSQIGDCLKEEFQDLVFLAQYTVCLISKISPSCMKYLCHKLYQFKFS